MATTKRKREDDDNGDKSSSKKSKAAAIKRSGSVDLGGKIIEDPGSPETNLDIAEAPSDHGQVAAFKAAPMPGGSLFWYGDQRLSDSEDDRRNIKDFAFCKFSQRRKHIESRKHTVFQFKANHYYVARLTSHPDRKRSLECEEDNLDSVPKKV